MLTITSPISYKSLCVSMILLLETQTLKFFSKNLFIFTEIALNPPREGPHPYVTVSVSLPDESPPPTPTNKNSHIEDDRLIQSVKYCR